MGLATAVAQAQSTVPGKPVTITESGYYTAMYGTDWDGGVTQAVQVIETVNILLDALRDGVSTTYFYELMNNIANPASTHLKDSFGRAPSPVCLRLGLIGDGEAERHL